MIAPVGKLQGSRAVYFEKYQDDRREWRWRLKAANGQTIADSGEGYTTEANCDNGINLVKSTNASTPVHKR